MSAPDGVDYGPPDPEYVPPDPLEASPRDRAVGVLMIMAPLMSCGAFAFVPSIWVAVQRRRDRRLLARALVTMAGFLVVYVLGAVLVTTASPDATGDPGGARGDLGIALVLACAVLGTALAVVQRRPKDVFRASSRGT